MRAISSSVRGIRALIPAALLAFGVAGCSESAPQSTMVDGDCADFYGGDVCSWAMLDGEGNVSEFGVTVPLAAIDNVPDDMELAWPPVVGAVVAMPPQVHSAMGVDHATLYWEPHGHPPGPYLTPHFDFHFYNVSSATREAIDCVETTKPAELPAGYTMIDMEIPGIGMLEGLCVPAMGMHAVLASELESESVFDGTMIIGYDRGAPLFFEPMISRELLSRRQTFDLPMPAVSGLPEGVRYPQGYTAEYDAEADAYRFTFSVS